MNPIIDPSGLPIDPLTGRPVAALTAPVGRPPSLARRFFQGLGEGVESVFGRRRNTMAGDATEPPFAGVLSDMNAALPQDPPTPPPPPPQPATDPGGGLSYPSFPRPLEQPETLAPPTPPLGPMPQPPLPEVIEPPAPPPGPMPQPPAPPPVASAVASAAAPQPPAPPQAPPEPGVLFSQTPAATGTEAFRAALIGRESSGRAGAQNSAGYSGLFQFGAPRLQTLGFYQPGQSENLRTWGTAGDNRWTGSFRIPGFPEVRTIEDFRNNPDAQNAAFEAHIADIDQAIENTPGAERFNRDGLRGVAHLGGNGGMRRFVETGGQHDPADSNGTRLSDYYRQFAGQQNTLRPNAPTEADIAPASAPPAVSPEPTGAGKPTGKPEGPVDFGDDLDMISRGGPSANQWFGLASGLLGGRGLADGLSRGLANFNEQSRLDQTQAIQRAQFNARRADGKLERAETRADRTAARTDAREDRRVQQEALAEYRRATLAQGQQRVDQAAQRGRQGAATPYSTLGSYRAEGGGLFIQRLNRSSGDIEWVNQQGAVVAPDQIPANLTRVQDTGEGAGNNAQARADVETTTGIYQEADAARTLRTSLANARTVLAQNPNLTGPDWQTRGINYIAEALGLDRSADLGALRQALQQGNMQTLMQIAPSLRPMSNVDLQAISQMTPSLLTDPRVLQSWLGQMDAAAERAERRSDALARAMEDPTTRAAILRSGGVAAWRQRWEAGEAAQRRPNGRPEPTIQPNPDGSPGYQHRTPGGVGFSFN